MKNFFTILLITFFLSQSSLAAASSDDDVIFREVNHYRMSQGLPALKIQSAISREAQQHSIDMAMHQVPFGHAGFKERVYRLVKIFSFNRAAENVAYAGKSDLNQIVPLWINSPPHRKNMLGDYNLTGIGMAENKAGEVFVTQIFLKGN